MAEALVHFDPGQPPLEVRFRGRYPNFQLEADKLRAKALADITPLCEDFLEIASTVFVADSTVSRGGSVRSCMGEAWRRDFRFEIPVRQPEVWRRPEVSAALVDAVSFLTEDNLQFEFLEGHFAKARQPYLEFDPAGPNFNAEEVILFSGGLDSFSGALETLSTTEDRVLFLSHRSAQKVIPRQDKLAGYLAERFPGRVQHLQVKARRRGPEGKETTQRSRSLLFTALGWAAARALKIPRLSFYENGTISHNLPISPQVIGTMATRTTHPLALAKLNTLLDLLEPGELRIENRYEWLTKTDIVRRIEQHGAADRIETAVSCTSVREQDSLRTHCGACSQCIDRRFAILAAGLEKYDPPERYAVDVLLGERERERSITIALEWTRHALRLRDLDERNFMSEFGHELMQIIRGHENLTAAEGLRRVRDLHVRHSQAVAGVLKLEVEKRAAEIVAGKLSATSLLALIVGQQGQPCALLQSDPRTEKLAPDPLGLVAEEDTVPKIGAPLVVAFHEEDGKLAISVEGFGRIKGKPARVAHALKPSFDQARAHGLAHEDHPFVQMYALSCLRDMTKNAIRQAITRCRNQLNEFHREVFGHPSSRTLLIQSGPARGHRLEPDLEIKAEARIDPHGQC
ncbi:MAG: hypothetical protein ACE369_02615 [Roseovarius sp.]